MLRTLARGVPACLAVTHVDGPVLARSAFHHPINHRSVVVLGTASLVADPAEKLRALEVDRAGRAGALVRGHRGRPGSGGAG